MIKEYYISELTKNDFNDYMNIMFEFTNYNYKLSKEQFDKYIDDMNREDSHFKIIVIKINNEIVGAGTIFKLVKLHNNPVGQIEDIIIKEKYRKYGLGKKIIEKLVDVGLNEMTCYKIILNCLDKNIGFYNKCGFSVIGNEMKYVHSP